MNDVYTRRNAPSPGLLRFDVPQSVRKRILHALKQLAEAHVSENLYPRILEETEKRLLTLYGELQGSPTPLSGHPVIDHFFCCDDEMVLDFIELWFQAWSYRSDNAGVEIVNKIFQEEGVGYELTPLVSTVTDKETTLFGRPAGKAVEHQYPRIIKKENQFIHQQVIKPCLEILSDPKFKTANSEMLKAHEEFRKGHDADAITSCGSAFESVLKTICQHKGWAYDPDKDTCSKLVGICKDKGLFPGFYAPILEATGTVRNKLGDAHGRGPTPAYSVEKEHVDHMLHLTSAHIVFLAKLAKI